MARAKVIGRAVKQPVRNRPSGWQAECEQINREKGKQRFRYSMRRRVMLMISIMIPAYMGLGAWWVWRSGELEQGMEMAGLWWQEQMQHAGFSLQHVQIDGLHSLPAELIMSKAELTVGAPILSLSLKEMQQKISELPEIRSVKLERELPDRLVITVVERRPYAIWQHLGNQQWVDRDGTVLSNQDQPSGSGHLILVGEDAPAHTEAFLDMMDAVPLLKTQVASAQRVGLRRWNVQLHNGMKVMLPELNPQAAWARFAGWVETKKILDRDVKFVDMRIDDRVFLSVQEIEKPKSSTLLSARQL